MAARLSLAAYCKNSVDGLWYCFDDSDVQQLSEDEVCTQTAYILFYQRRTAIPSWSANSSVAGKADPAGGRVFLPRVDGCDWRSRNFSRRAHDAVGWIGSLLISALNLESRMLAVEEVGVDLRAPVSQEFPWRWSRAWLKARSWCLLVEAAQSSLARCSQSRGAEGLGQRTDTWLCRVWLGYPGACPIHATYLSSVIWV